MPWIMASQFLIHTDCTTAVEAIWLKDRISVLPNHLDYNYICPLPVELSVSSNANNLLNDISSSSNQSYINDNKKIILENYFSYSKKSLKIITDDLIANANSNGKINIFKMLMHLIRFRLTNLKKLVKIN